MYVKVKSSGLWNDDARFGLLWDGFCGEFKRRRRIDHKGKIGNCHETTRVVKFSDTENALFGEIDPEEIK